ncbi:MAG: hypothetical protein P4L66_08125 [Acetobacteraceae bacterium]|nr:hypothetical protein [Acetobacteraceae bacterium]
MIERWRQPGTGRRLMVIQVANTDKLVCADVSKADIAVLGNVGIGAPKSIGKTGDDGPLLLANASIDAAAGGAAASDFLQCDAHARDDVAVRVFGPAMAARWRRG